jgi:glycosyltransferase involved in cell wall biosynthesis
MRPNLDDNSEQRARTSIVVVGNFNSNPSCEAFLERLLVIITPLFHEILLMSGDAPANLSSKVRSINTLDYFRGGKIPRYLGYAIAQVRISYFLLRIQTKESHSQYALFLSPMLFPLIIAKMKGMMIILYSGGLFPHAKKSGLFFHLKKIILKSVPSMIASKIVVESKASIEFQGLAKFIHKIEISPQSIDLNAFSITIPYESRQLNIGFIGVFDENKGVIRFIKSLAPIRNLLLSREARILVAGSGPMENEIREETNRNNLSELLRVIEWIPHEEMPRYLNRLRFVVMPSKSEGVPNLALEAMACGTIILATPIGGIPDLIIDGSNGFIISENSPWGISQTIIRALESNSLEQISQCARKTIEDIHSPDEVSRQWCRIFKMDNVF